jgi:hypothetical protein
MVGISKKKSYTVYGISVLYSFGDVNSISMWKRSARKKKKKKKEELF